MHFNESSETEANMALLSLVNDYCNTYLQPNKCQNGAGNAQNSLSYTPVEVTELIRQLLSPNGDPLAQCEATLAHAQGIAHCALVNSGLSANLIALATLTSPLLGERSMRPGDEVITVAVGGPATVAPILQLGAVPVVVDVTLPQYNVDVSQLEAALSPKTKAVMLTHTLGNPFDLKTVRNFCNDYELWLIEDAREALGAAYDFDGTTYQAGTVGDIGTGCIAHTPRDADAPGVVYTRDHTLFEIIQSLCNRGLHKSGTSYTHFGYELRATVPEAILAAARLSELPQSIATAHRQATRLLTALQPVSDRLILPHSCPNATPRWLYLPLTCGEGISRAALLAHLADGGITAWPLAPYLLREPCFDRLRREGGYRTVGSLPVTQRIAQDTLLLPLCSPDGDAPERIAQALAEALRKCHC